MAFLMMKHSSLRSRVIWHMVPSGQPSRRSASSVKLMEPSGLIGYLFKIGIIEFAVFSAIKKLLSDFLFYSIDLSRWQFIAISIKVKINIELFEQSFIYHWLMNVNRKAYLAGKLVEFLNQTGTRQQDLADFAEIGQGLVADHIRRKSFPKITILLKYRDFFTRKLARVVTLYELTNDPIFKDIEQKVEAIKDGSSSLSTKGREFARLYDSITDESKKELIEAMVINAAERKMKKGRNEK